MEDMIARIIDMDKKARDITNKAQQTKVDYEKEIILKKEKIKQDYLERAKERVKVNRQNAQKKADDSLKKIEAKNAAVMEKLKKTDAENHDRWVSEIVQRVLGE